jgi:hypothetical protein
MGNMTGLRLQQEQEIAVFLGSIIVREETFLRVGGVIEMAGDFILLRGMSVTRSRRWYSQKINRTSSNAMRF